MRTGLIKPSTKQTVGLVDDARRALEVGMGRRRSCRVRLADRKPVPGPDVVQPAHLGMQTFKAHGCPVDRSAVAHEPFAESDEQYGVALVRRFDREPPRKVYRGIHCLSFGTIDLR